MANLGDISKINLPNGNVVNIKDTTARSNVVLLETMNGAKNLAPYNSGEHTGNASYWFLHTNCIDIAAGTSVYLVFDYTQTAGQYSLQLTDENGQIISGTSAYTTEGTTSGHKAAKVTIPTGKTAKGYNSYHNSNATVTISNFMIVPAEIYEAGFTSYQPYALPNTKITPELIELVDSGAKNLLELDFASQTVNGVVFTKNNDGTVTVTGTLTAANAPLVIGAVELPAGTYVLSGTPSGGGESTWQIDTTTPSYYQDTGSGVSITLTQTTTVTVRIRIAASGTLNLLFKPMLCTKSAWDVSQKYVPYAPSNAELYSTIGDINTVLEEVL